MQSPRQKRHTYLSPSLRSGAILCKHCFRYNTDIEKGGAIVRTHAHPPGHGLQSRGALMQAAYGSAQGAIHGEGLRETVDPGGCELEAEVT